MEKADFVEKIRDMLAATSSKHDGKTFVRAQIRPSDDSVSDWLAIIANGTTGDNEWARSIARDFVRDVAIDAAKEYSLEFNVDAEYLGQQPNNPLTFEFMITPVEED